MLIEFTVGNHLSIKEKKTLSLEASSIKDYEDNIFMAGNYTLVKSAAIYGANSSGKSNLINSLTTMKNIVRTSAQKSSTDKIDVKPFLLNTETEKKPTYFEILILIENVRYRYGFEVNESSIQSEWLFRCKSKTEHPLFIREKDKIEITKDFPEGNGIEARTRENALFLSSVDQWNGEISKKIITWFNSQLYVISGLDHEVRRNVTLTVSRNATHKNQFDRFLTQFNLGFNKFKVDSSKKSKDQIEIQTLHNKYGPDGSVIGSSWLDLFKQESSGTNKIFDLAGYFMAGLILGKTIVIDELDAKLHPLLTMSLVKLFNSPERNPKNGQLIFATHDTNLLSHGCLRRDQIYFTEKNQFEETDLYSLVEYKDVKGVKARNDSSFEKDYINGRYGAIPFIGDFSNLLIDGKDIEN